MNCPFCNIKCEYVNKNDVVTFLCYKKCFDFYGINKNHYYFVHKSYAIIFFKGEYYIYSDNNFNKLLFNFKLNCDANDFIQKIDMLMCFS